MGARYRLIVSGEHVELSDSSTQDVVWKVKWDENARILAWKQDCGTFDTICLGFCHRDEDDMWICDEDVEGWPELLNVLGQRFAVDRDWWSKVAFPAFETNLTVVWCGDLPEGAASGPSRTGGENHDEKEH